MGKVQSSDHRSRTGTNTKSRKESKTKVDERRYFGHEKKEGKLKVIAKNMKPSIRE